MQVKYTFGDDVKKDPYHIDIMRGRMTRNLTSTFPRLREEITAAFNTIIPPRDGKEVRLRIQCGFMMTFYRVGSISCA